MHLLALPSPGSKEVTVEEPASTVGAFTGASTQYRRRTEYRGHFLLGKQARLSSGGALLIPMWAPAPWN